ncbi:hypothetical protein OUZ56_010382 [Daphnia magna]|uniref:DUF6570 domain-containing protein n=1 Tax=Daphnia magna TaxID=35525 RepID=A0ABR0AIE0_9CRUS|nr:hypothetical protein OUZ56_010382 [Daphnia magna]
MGQLPTCSLPHNGKNVNNTKKTAVFNSAANNYSTKIVRNAERKDKQKICKETASFDVKASLFGCALCDVREFQMGLDKTKHFCDRHLSELGKFHKTPEQYAAWLKIKQKFRPVFSWFKGFNSTIYNFHPECVNTNLDADGNVIELVKLCPVCPSCADNVEQSFPRYSIANGIDYGVFSRLSWLKPLSLTEEHAISLTRPYGCIVKLSGFNCAERQSAKKGHFIFFRQAQAA